MHLEQDKRFELSSVPSTEPQPNPPHPMTRCAKQKARYGDIAGSSYLVAWDGIEPSTRGFSIRCSTN
jgi:hypothetical protein